MLSTNKILWISAFAAVAAWNAKGMKQGAIDKKLSASSGSCSTFAYGTATKCTLAKATTGLGVALWFVSYLSQTKVSLLTNIAFSFSEQHVYPE